MEDFVIPTTNCPYCGKDLDGSTNMQGDRPPKNGDVTICLTCEQLGVFVISSQNEIFGIRMPTGEEHERFKQNHEIQFFLHCLRRAKELRAEEDRRREVPPCPCECNSGGFCGGCGHRGCGGRRR